MIIAIDTETYEYNDSKGVYEPILDARKFILGCAVTDTGKTMFFEKREEMYNWLIETVEKNHKRRRRTYIYAHNMEYDWYAIAKGHYLDDKMKYIMFNNFLGIYDNKGYFLDTMFFYKMALSKVGELLGFPKKEMPKEIKKIEELKEYLLRDTEIVLKAILHIKKQLNDVGFTPRKLLTAGQVAMTTFMSYCKKNHLTHGFMKYNPEMHRKEVIKTQYPKLVREAYRGGDNQAFKIGKYENVRLIDINGLYADIMRKMDFPDLGSEIYNEKPNKYMFLKYIENEIGVAKIKIKCPIMDNPLLMIRYLEYQIVPNGCRMRGTWTFAEIKKAIKEGYELEEVEWCIRWQILKKRDGIKLNPLKDFIEKIYSIEKNCETKAGKIPIKLLRNNLSGKFAQYKRNKTMKLVERRNVMQYIEQGFRTISRFEDKYVIEREEDEYIAGYTNPIISTYITALGRIRIHEERKKIPKERLLYNDTDSLMFIDKTGKILKKFKISKELGDWKLENKEDIDGSDVKILGEKRYYIGKKVKISGIASKDRNKDTIDKEENIVIKRMKGMRTALQTNNWNELGGFEDISIEMKPHNKLMIPIPEYIDETGKKKEK